MRIAIGVSYDGSGLEGWQAQPSMNTVQDHLERALAGIAGEAVRVTGAGRTDAGVHATGQVAHFDCNAPRPESAWVRGVNAGLPDQIAVQWAKQLDEDFHARFSAVERSYRYVLYNHPVRPGIASRQATWFHRPLDVERMRAAASLLTGKHDFSAFRSSACQAKSPVKTLSRAVITTNGPYVLFDFSSDAFLHHMVRNMVGCLIYVGKGKYPPQWLGDVLQGRDRKAAAPTAAACGLYLTRVAYEARWQLPDFARMMPFREST